MQTITVKHALGAYEIYYGTGILEKALNDVLSKKDYDRIFTVTDTNVAPLYLDRVKNAVADSGYAMPQSFIFAAGEKNKNLNTVSEMYEAFANAGITRSSLIIALGGGVCGDMAGFAGATYLRGIDVLQIPTTLLAQVDSSIGGKTGVDSPVGKNMIGAFKQPVAVISDAEFLKTLPEHYMKDGMGEVIKYGCIADAGLFDSVQSGSFALDSVIEKCIKIKADVVTNDERENGLRMILNYGHTLGHAVEKAGNYEKYSHGEAVGIGMLYAAKIGIFLGYDKGIYDKIYSALKNNSLPTDMVFEYADLLNTVSADKKRKADSISFVFLRQIGVPVIQPVSIDVLKNFG